MAAYGAACARHKHHYNRHLPDMLMRFGVLLNTLAHGRKHRLVERYALAPANLQSYDLGVLENVTTHMLWDTEQGFLAP